MHSNHHTLQQHHNTTSRTSQRQQQQFFKNTRPTCIPSSTHLSTSSNQHDPFANMNTYVDYQQKIESLKTSLVSTKSSGPPPPTTKKLDDSAQRTRPLDSVKRHHSRQHSFTIDITEDEVGRLWGNGSVISSGSSSSGASTNGCLTPPRSSSPITTANHQSLNDDDSDSCYVTMEDKARFLAFLRHRTGWHTGVTDTTMDLDYMKNSSSLFFWYG